MTGMMMTTQGIAEMGMPEPKEEPRVVRLSDAERDAVLRIPIVKSVENAGDGTVVLTLKAFDCVETEERAPTLHMKAGHKLTVERRPYYIQITPDDGAALDHPNIGGRFCWGNVESAAHTAMGEKDAPALIAIACEFLQTYNNSDRARPRLIARPRPACEDCIYTLPIPGRCAHPKWNKRWLVPPAGGCIFHTP